MADGRVLANRVAEVAYFLDAKPWRKLGTSPLAERCPNGSETVDRNDKGARRWIGR